VRAEFYREDTPEQVVGRASWSGSGVEVSADGETEAILRRIFRPTAVAIDDASFRGAGSAGPSVLPPGSFRWFNAAARVRAKEEGLGVRFVPEGESTMGFDPAGSYRTFNEQIERKEAVGHPPAPT
jgi:hypothetical protein